MHSYAQGKETIQLWGELSGSYRMHATELDDGESNGGDRRLLQVKVNAIAPIWRSWFGLAEGSVSLNSSVSDVDDGPSSRDFFGTGTARIRLFPQSNFPFAGYLERTDRRAETDLSDSDFQTTRYGFEQEYRTKSGSTTFFGRYEHGDHKSKIDGESDDLQLSMSRHWSGQQLQFNANALHRTDDADNEIRDYFFVGRHSYFNTSEISIETLATISDTDHSFEDSQRLMLTKQLSSFLSWRPETRRPLTVTASFRALALDTEETQENHLETTSDLQNMTLTSGVNYQPSPTVNVFGTASRSENATDVASQTIGNESVGVDYNSLGIFLGEYVYSWGTGGSVSRFNSDLESDVRSSITFRQGVTRDLLFQDQRQLTLSFDQRLGYEDSDIFGQEQRINHTLTLRGTPFANATNTMFQLNISDMRRAGRIDEESQLLNAQFSTSVPLNRRSFWNADITLQGMRTKTEDSMDSNLIASAQVSYQNHELFRQRGLRFKTELRAASDNLVDQDDEQRLGFNARERARWRTDIDYHIGLLQVKLIKQLVRYDSGLNWSVEFKVIRRFDGY